MQRRRTAKRRRTGGKTGDIRRQKTKTAGFSVLRVTYESVFCLNELLQQLRGKRGRACVRRVQRGRDHVTLTRCNVLKKQMNVDANIAKCNIFLPRRWVATAKSIITLKLQQRFYTNITWQRTFCTEKCERFFFFVFSQTGCIIKDDI